MDEPWTPPLRLSESDGRCRLTLVGVTSGHGLTLQEAADDLVARILDLVAAVRGTGFRAPSELGPPDLRLYSFLHELSEIGARGDDIRPRLFGGSSGSVGETDVAA
jgi:hypothetical protein